MKTAILAVTAIVLTSSAALAAPSRYHAYRSHDGGNVSSYERAAIARSAHHLASIKRRAWADGRVTFFERIQIRIAENSYNRLLHRAWRS